LQLGELHALGTGYPLRGEFKLAGPDGREFSAGGVPQTGTAWLSRAGAERLGARIGDTLTVGDARLRLAALVAQEPDAALDYFDVAPKVFANLADLPGTGLVQEGSRVGYRLIVPGAADAVQQFTATARSEERRVGKAIGYKLGP